MNCLNRRGPSVHTQLLQREVESRPMAVVDVVYFTPYEAKYSSDMGLLEEGKPRKVKQSMY